MSAEFFSLSSDDFEKEFQIEIRSSYEEIHKFHNLLNEAFVKIDVEGMEADILKSLLPLLNDYKPIIAVEWAPSEQPVLKDLMTSIKNYTPYGCYISQPKNAFFRQMKNIFMGREYCLEKINYNNLEVLYPLVFLIPDD